MADRIPSPDTELRAARREGERREADASRSPSLDADVQRLFGAHEAKLRRLCLRLTGDRARAEELMQDTLTTAWRRLPDFHGGSRFGPWLFGIARHTWRNQRRKRTEWLTDDGVLHADDPGVGALRSLQRHEREQLVTEAAAGLSAQEQEAVHLRYVEGLSIARIDELLGLTGSGARGLLQRCRRKLKQAIEARLVALGHGESLLRSDGR